MKKDIRAIVTFYAQKFKTRNPFEIADSLKILISIGPLGSSCGSYMFIKNHRCIFLNEDLSEHDMQLVMAHELGHAIMHRNQNCYFIRNKTLLLNSKVEKEANVFAVELLIDDNTLSENQHCTTSQLSRLLGYDQRLIELRLQNNDNT